MHPCMGPARVAGGDADACMRPMRASPRFLEVMGPPCTSHLRQRSQQASRWKLPHPQQAHALSCTTALPPPLPHTTRDLPPVPPTGGALVVVLPTSVVVAATPGPREGQHCHHRHRWRAGARQQQQQQPVVEVVVRTGAGLIGALALWVGGDAAQMPGGGVSCRPLDQQSSSGSALADMTPVCPMSAWEAACCVAAPSRAHAPGAWGGVRDTCPTPSWQGRVPPPMNRCCNTPHPHPPPPTHPPTPFSLLQRLAHPPTHPASDPTTQLTTHPPTHPHW